MVTDSCATEGTMRPERVPCDGFESCVCLSCVRVCAETVRSHVDIEIHRRMSEDWTMQNEATSRSVSYRTSSDQVRAEMHSTTQ